MQNEFILSPVERTLDSYHTAHMTPTSCVYTLTGTPTARARPKSANFMVPFLSISRFCGFKSRCKTLLWWQNKVPRRSWYIQLYSQEVQQLQYNVYAFNNIKYLYFQMYTKRSDSCSIDIIELTFTRAASMNCPLGIVSKQFFKSMDKNSNTK